MKPGQENNTDMNMEPLARLQEAETQVRAKSHVLRKKSLLLFSSSMILMMILIMAAIAWYTRVANTYAVTFDVAEYDLAVNENVEDEYLLNVYSYSSVKNETMAPGTIGWIPFKISAYRGDVNVFYQMSITNQMSTEMRKHIRFFYLKEKNGSGGAGGIHYGDAVDTVNGLSSYVKVYLDHDSTTENPDQIQDIIEKGESKTLCLYWEWYLNADEATRNGVSVTDAERTAWDELDTDIGRYPDKYYDAFVIYINTSGSQVVPADGTRQRQTSSQ